VQWIPAYEKLEIEGKLAQRISKPILSSKIASFVQESVGESTKGEKGVCRAPVKPVVFSYHPHFGEECVWWAEKGPGPSSSLTVISAVSSVRTGPFLTRVRERNSK